MTLANGTGVVMLDGQLILSANSSRLICEVLDPEPSAHRCVHEYEVLLENAQLELQSSRLNELLPDLPQTWRVVKAGESETTVLWP